MLMIAIIAIVCVTGCGNNVEETAGNSTGESNVAEDADQAVAALIDAIYVQERNDKTDKQCADAKVAWDISFLLHQC